jgi:hypothetical protein
MQMININDFTAGYLETTIFNVDETDSFKVDTFLNLMMIRTDKNENYIGMFKRYLNNTPQNNSRNDWFVLYQWDQTNSGFKFLKEVKLIGNVGTITQNLTTVWDYRWIVNKLFLSAKIDVTPNSDQYKTQYSFGSCIFDVNSAVAIDSKRISMKCNKFSNGSDTARDFEIYMTGYKLGLTRINLPQSPWVHTTKIQATLQSMLFITQKNSQISMTPSDKESKSHLSFRIWH